MAETLDISQSSDLLNDFLNQQDSSLEGQHDNKIINDEGDTSVDKITTNPSKEIEIINDLPEGFDFDKTVDDPIDDDVTIDNSEDNSTEDNNYSFKALAGYLSEEGIIDFEDAEGLEDTPEVLFESVKNTIAKEIQSYKDSIPDKAKKLIEYIEKGGDIDTYLEVIQKPFDIKNIDLTSESDQEKVVREYFKLQDYTQEEIDDTINDYKDSLILEKQAKVVSKQLVKHFDKAEEALIKSQEQELEARQEQYSKYITQVNTTIDTAEALAGLPITPKEKSEFKKYLLMTDKQGMTQYAKEVAEDPVKTQLELAYIKFKKFDFSNAAKKGETAATKRLKDIFKSNETNIKTGKSIEQTTSSISDLSAFEQFKARNK